MAPDIRMQKVSLKLKKLIELKVIEVFCSSSSRTKKKKKTSRCRKLAHSMQPNTYQPTGRAPNYYKSSNLRPVIVPLSNKKNSQPTKRKRNNRRGEYPTPRQLQTSQQQNKHIQHIRHKGNMSFSEIFIHKLLGIQAVDAQTPPPLLSFINIWENFP